MGLKISVSKTADGTKDYLQIMSDDMFSTNIVLIADKITINDARPKEESDGSE